jgi:hypothetical protein
MEVTPVIFLLALVPVLAIGALLVNMLLEAAPRTGKRPDTGAPSARGGALDAHLNPLSVPPPAERPGGRPGWWRTPGQNPDLGRSAAAGHPASDPGPPSRGEPDRSR